MSQSRREKRKSRQLSDKARLEMGFMQDIKFITRLDTETRVMEIFARRKVAMRKLWGPPIIRYYKRLLGINPFEQLLNLEKHYGSIEAKDRDNPGKEGNSGIKQGPGTDSKGG